jgi:pimeloyl-ACP methyl ester carboxylesterase
MTNVMRYGDGLSLAYVDYGDAGGYPIFVQHGMVASIGDGLFGALVDAGMRVVCAARPGYGESSPRELACLGDWGDLVALLAVELGIERFDVLGISSGAPYAYAIAHRLPAKVGKVFVFSGIPALCDDRVAAAWPYPIDRKASLDECRALARQIFFSDLPPESAAMPHVRESMMNDCFGPGLDLRIRARDWGFSPSDVAQRVYMQHARDDGDVPFAAAELTAGLLPDCAFEARDSGGHFSPELLDGFIEKTILAP